MTYPEPVTGTIFDADLPASQDSTYLRQRRCGLFVLHDVNPAAIAEGKVTVERIESLQDDRIGDWYRVNYLALYLPPGDSQWVTGTIDPKVTLTFNPPRDTEALPFPLGVTCDHDPDKPHKVVRRRSFDVTWDEIALQQPADVTAHLEDSP